MNNSKKISVVINTLNRADVLPNALASLKFQTYRNFEVIVVNGPSKDHTKEILNYYKDCIKIVNCPKANLSLSRNLGINASAGEIVVFIDDDACATTDFLQVIADGYSNNKIGGVGTQVYGPDGIYLQMVPFFVNKEAEPIWDIKRHRVDYYYPETPIFGHMVGCSSSFLKKALLEIGGFDERIEYFLDETDVCYELHKKGYHIQIAGESPKIFHYWAKAAHRNEERVILAPGKIIENKFYFSIKSATSVNKKIALQNCDLYLNNHIEDAKKHLKNGRMTQEQFDHFVDEAQRGRKLGISKSQSERLNHKFDKVPSEFKPYTPAQNALGKKKIVIISKSDFRFNSNGIAKFSYNLASALAKSGNEVRVITKGDENSIEYYEDFWIHTVSHDIKKYETNLVKFDISRELLSWSATVANCLNGIIQEFGVDTVSAPIWDLEGFFAADLPSVNFVLTLHTNFHEYFEINEGIRKSEEVAELLSLERAYIEKSKIVHANSNAICSQILEKVGFDLLSEPYLTKVIPHGCYPPKSIKSSVRQAKKNKKINIGFLGRLEERKGFDIFYDFAVYAKKNKFPFEFHVIGSDTNAVNGKSYLSNLNESRGIEGLDSILKYHGFLDEDSKNELLSNMDLMLLPSRFESFGFVYIESLSHGLPVVCLNEGAAPEVIKNLSTGVIVDKVDMLAFKKSIDLITKSDAILKKFKLNCKNAFDENYSMDAWTERLKSVY